MLKNSETAQSIVAAPSIAEVIDARVRIPPVPPEPPPWVAEWIGSAVHETAMPGGQGLGLVRIARGPRFSLVTLGIDEVPGLADDRFESLVTAAYRTLQTLLAAERRHPIRFWNFIPGIQEPMATSEQRYMVFNAGRFRAFETWFGATSRWRDAVPTASSVGVSGTTLFVHCLAADSPGRPLENPRQHSAYTYSARYGPRPPLFARATIVDSSLLVGGTASILGEQTVHADDIARQTQETFDNLATLVRAACGAAAADDRPAPWEWLERFRTVRIHVLRSADASYAADVVRAHIPSLQSVEFVQADLCRPDLLLEVEGVASTNGDH